ncbi:MAG: hypothetical protein WD490_10565 [Opitutales bacterium]
MKKAQPGKIPLEEREAKASADFAAGRLRRARDTFKQLAKEDRERFLPRLIECNIALAFEMIAKGQVSEADQIIAYLKTIAPPEAIEALQVPRAVAEEDWEKVTRSASAALDAGQGDGTSGRIRLADALVVAGNPPPPSTSRNPLAWREDFDRLLEALRAVSDGRFEAAAESLRPIGRGSIFAEWKLFVRALVAFYEGEGERADRLFAAVGKESVPGKAAQVFSDLGRTPAELGGLSVKRLRATGELLGRTPKEAQAVALSERAWSSGDAVAAYKSLVDGGIGFPSEEEGWKSALMEWFATAQFSMDERTRDEYGEFFWTRLVNGRGPRNAAEGRLAARVTGNDEVDDEAIEVAWTAFVKHYEADFGSSPKLKSRAWTRIGSAFAAIEPRGFFEAQDHMRDPNKAIRYLRAAVDLDPANLQAHLRLVDVYEFYGQKSARNKLLDEMVKRFPRTKEVLLRAGELCLERKAFKKGLDFLERARELDPLDRSVSAAVFRGLCRMARNFFTSGKAARGREALARARDFTHPASGDPDEGLPFLLAREAVMEELFGDAGTGKARKEQALAEAEKPLIIRFFLAGVAIAYRLRPGPAPSHVKELQSALRNEVTVADCVQIWPILKYVRGLLSSKSMPHANQWYSECLRFAMERPFTGNEVCRLGHLCGSEGTFEVQLRPLILEGLKKDPGNPGLTIMKCLISHEISMNSLDSLQLDELAHEAERRGDAESLQLIKNVKEARPPRLPDFDDVDELDDFDPEDELDASGLADEDENLLDIIANLSNAEFKALKREMADEIPGVILDELRKKVKEAAPGPVNKAGRSSGPPAPKKAPKSVSRPPPSADDDDGRQLELF